MSELQIRTPTNGYKGSGLAGPITLTADQALRQLQGFLKGIQALTS
jgi:hypothetical protein